MVSKIGIVPPLCPCIQESRVGRQQLSCSQLRKFGPGSHSCLICSNQHGPICKYYLNVWCPWFGQYAKDMSFMKLD
ncbi:40S ribosomal protein S29-like [Rousettus aegyptiacus]|uniref:40S ribosomal protein S29-like n=1 Tax=Rousettus aegyptiacus TaxID=9407 RepID=UPI00168D2FA6|nr:40S ribosomal protein S29-like [Rousettus aegyptiacus]